MPWEPSPPSYAIRGPVRRPHQARDRVLRVEVPGSLQGPEIGLLTGGHVDERSRRGRGRAASPVLGRRPGPGEPALFRGELPRCARGGVGDPEAGFGRPTGPSHGSAIQLPSGDHAASVTVKVRSGSDPASTISHTLTITSAPVGGGGGSAGTPSDNSERARMAPVMSATMTPRAPARIRRLRCLRSRRSRSRSKSPCSRSTLRLCALEGVRDPRHRPPPSPCGTRRARSASTSGPSSR